MSYNFNAIEAKWQKYWKDKHTFEAKNPTSTDAQKAEPFYVLDMFPYPSGTGLHVGHPLGYIASDIMARYKRHKGFNVLHPMGYDSFGLPAEQYAIQTGQHPAITTEANINRYREQLDKIGFSFDWSREVRTSSPEYYRWTQWIFIQLFNSWYDQQADKARDIEELITIFETQGNLEVQAICTPAEDFTAEEWNSFSKTHQEQILLNYRLTYLAETEVNWCPGLGTVLANDEIVNGVSERGGYPVVRKKMKQWSMRITAYAERLLQGLNTIDWTDSLKESQRNWIGKSQGASIRFSVSPEETDVELAFEDEETPENAHLFAQAKTSRETPTEAQALLWEHLKDNGIGFTFKSQVVVGGFIAHFVCQSQRLIVEIDRKAYTTSEEYRLKRTEALNQKGYTVLHFEHDDLMADAAPILKEIKTQLKALQNERQIEVFTTRPDTIFGVSFMTLAPEHDLVLKITTPEQRDAVKHYIEDTAKRSERDRVADVKTVTGVFTGAYAEHPFTKAPIPIWIADYVLSGYGTGAVMAVPAGDERDYKFAKHFNIPIINIFEGVDISQEAFAEKGETKLMNSDFLNGKTYTEALALAIEKLEAQACGAQTINYRLRDAVFSRQRYWGEPFPVYYKNGLPQMLPENCLPLHLPEVEKYLPTSDGEPPLGRAAVWYWNEEKQEVTAVDDSDQIPEGIYPLELNTMPGWAGSSWYFFRYMEKEQRDSNFASAEALNYWKDVDLYIGGSEHATGHLLYARFWAKFLKDRGFAPVEEPFKKLINQGMILGESAFVHRLECSNTYVSANQIKDRVTQPIHVDVALVNTSNQLDKEGFKIWRPDFAEAEFISEDDGTFLVTREVEKMSKSKFNVVNPDDICEEYGADSLRLYEMFLGPLEQAKPWSTAGLSGVHGFLKKLWNLYHTTPKDPQEEPEFAVSDEAAPKDALKVLHKTIEKVTHDIETFSFNTAVSSLMICVNDLQKLKCNHREVLEPLAILVAPYAPHIAEELWEKLGHTDSISTATYPIFDPNLVKESTKTYPISFNGKKRFTLDLDLSLSKDDIEAIVMNDDRTKDQLNGRTPKRVIIVPGKIVNIVG